MPHTTNRRIVLASRPRGEPALTDFRLEQAPVPEPGPGQVLLRTLHLSLDPYMRNLMDAGGTRYAPEIAIGAPMVGGTVSRVAASRHPQWKEGDLVLASAGWQDYALSDGGELLSLGALAQPAQVPGTATQPAPASGVTARPAPVRGVDAQPSPASAIATPPLLTPGVSTPPSLTPSVSAHPSLALGVLGMPAFTAYVGLLDIGAPQPGETVVVAAATGAVGSVVGQLARLKGARVVGIAGGRDKCRHAVEELGFDACIDRRDAQFAQQLASACPQGIDVYFENVGGAVFDAVLPLLNLHARVPVCGFIAHYNDKNENLGYDRLPALTSAVLQRRIRMQGFIILDHYATRFEAFQREMGAWVAQGKVKQREHIVAGLEHAPAAFIGMLKGENFGKVVVNVGG